MAYSGRFIIVLILILILLLFYNPDTRQAVIETWQNIRPALVAFLDNLYAAIRDLLTGSSSDSDVDQQPAGPELNFDRIVTMVRGGSR
jgi:hypothetical protein